MEIAFLISLSCLVYTSIGVGVGAYYNEKYGDADPWALLGVIWPFATLFHGCAKLGSGFHKMLETRAQNKLLPQAKVVKE